MGPAQVLNDGDYTETAWTDLITRETGKLRKDMEGGFKAVDARFDAVDARFDDMEKVLRAIAAKV